MALSNMSKFAYNVLHSQLEYIARAWVCWFTPEEHEAMKELDGIKLSIANTALCKAYRFDVKVGAGQVSFYVNYLAGEYHSCSSSSSGTLGVFSASLEALQTLTLAMLKRLEQYARDNNFSPDNLAH